MRTLLLVLFCIIIVFLSYGIYHKNYIEFNTGEFIIGLTVLTGSFIYLPLFLYYRWKGKKLKDYTLNEENLKKMKKKKLVQK